MSWRRNRLVIIHFSHAPQNFKPYESVIRGNRANWARRAMTRRRPGAMPAATVIAALVVIALVAFTALFLWSGSSDGAAAPGARSVPAAGPDPTGR